MPRYYFGFFNDVDVRDPVGTILRNDDEAWSYAEGLKKDLLLTTGAGNWRIRITDEEGRIVGEMFPDGKSDDTRRSDSSPVEN